MPQLRPLRQYNETDTVNMFAYQGSMPALAGTFVKINSGFLPADVPGLDNNGFNLWTNTQSPRWKTPTNVVATTNSGDNTIGLLLYDVREQDENGEKLVFHPQKAYDNNWVISGQTARILQKGFVTYSGIDGFPVGTGDYAYLASGTNNAGGLSTSGTPGVTTRVGRFYGPKDANGAALLQLDIN